MSRAPHPVSAGDVVAGKYAIEAELGTGGMGIVFAARDRLLDRRVAIKFLHPRLLVVPTASERFMREARAATRITSEHGVNVIEVGVLGTGLPFMVMEHLRGRDLGTLLRDDGPLDPARAVDFVMQALLALAEAHAKRIVHRDIKPSNLFLTRRLDGSALVKVLDFGIAKTLDRDSPSIVAITSSEDVRLGSSLYMSPEQLQDPRAVDCRSDIWAVGVTLYELVAGRTPFSGSTPFEVMSKIMSEAPPPLGEGREMGVEVGLERVIRTCLAREPARRFESVRALAAALAPFGGDDANVALTRIQGLTSRRADEPSNSALKSSAESRDTRNASRRLPQDTEPSPAAHVSFALEETASAFGRNPAKRQHESARLSRRLWTTGFVMAMAGATVGGVAAVRLFVPASVSTARATDREPTQFVRPLSSASASSTPLPPRTPSAPSSTAKSPPEDAAPRRPRVPHPPREPERAPKRSPSPSAPEPRPIDTLIARRK